MLKLDNRQAYPHCLQASLLARDAGDRHLEILALLYGHEILTAVGEFGLALETDAKIKDHPSQPRILQALALMHLAIFHYHAGDLVAAAEFSAQARQSMSGKEARFEYHLCFLRMVEGMIAYHREEPDPFTEQQLEEALAEVTRISSYLFMAEGHWVLALWRWQQGSLAAAAAHLKAGMAVAAQRGSYYSILLSPRGRIFTPALELGVEEVWDHLPPLLAPLAEMVEPDLVRLSRHAPHQIAAKALELRRGLYRRGLPRLDIRTLGEFRLLHDQEPLDEAVWERKQPKLLLQALVARGSVNVPQDVQRHSCPWHYDHKPHREFYADFQRDLPNYVQWRWHLGFAGCFGNS